MELTITKETLLKILTIYYKENEDFTGTIEAAPFISEDYHRNEKYENPDVTFTMNGKLEFFGEDISYSKELTKDEVQEILENFLTENGIELQGVVYDARIKDTLDGNEMSVSKAKNVEFSGIKCEVKKEEKRNLKMGKEHKYARN